MNRSIHNNISIAQACLKSKYIKCAWAKLFDEIISICWIRHRKEFLKLLGSTWCHCISHCKFANLQFKFWRTYVYMNFVPIFTYSILWCYDHIPLIGIPIWVLIITTRRCIDESLHHKNSKNNYLIYESYKCILLNAHTLVFSSHTLHNHQATKMFWICAASNFQDYKWNEFCALSWS